MQQTALVEERRELTEAAYYTVGTYPRRFPWTECADVSAKYRAMVGILGLGASGAPSLTAYSAAGEAVGWVSYNGRVWAGKPGGWRVAGTLVYCPSWERQR